MIINSQNVNEEYSKEVQEKFKEIIKKESEHIELTSCEAAMLFFWQRHAKEPRFNFLTEYLESNELKVKHKKKHKYFWRKKI